MERTIEMIGRYEIIEEIGRGGMATVYLAYDPLVKRDVAIKILPLEFTHDPTFRARFEREGLTIGKLQNPNIVPVFDIGNEDGQPYLVMQYMPGGSLADRIVDGGIGLEAAKPVIHRIAEALDDAHRNGIIHRDLKPANFLFDKNGNVFLADFGIVKLATENQTLTGTHILGTPAYMSPEQARGNIEIDHRSDVYALGAILFEMLTGRTPYKADTPLGQAIAQVNEPIPKLTEFNKHLPPGIDEVIGKAMAKDRDDRFDSATEFAEALDLIEISPSRFINVKEIKEESAKAEIAGPVMPPPPPPSTPSQVLGGWLPIFVFGGLILVAILMFGNGSVSGSFFGGETETPIPVAVVETETAEPTQTPTLTPTNTLVPPTDTPTAAPTDTPEPESTPTDEPTATSTPVDTPTPTETLIPTSTPIIDPEFVVTVNSAIIRYGPDASYDRLFGADEGEVLRLIAKNDDETWYNIEFAYSNGTTRTGWISANVGEINIDVEDIEIAATIPPTNTPEPTATPTVSPDVVGTPTSNDFDGDGIPNIIDTDLDGDSIPNLIDDDMDGDGILNISDDDIDGDLLPNKGDQCPQEFGFSGDCGCRNACLNNPNPDDGDNGGGGGAPPTATPIDRGN